MFQKYRTYTHKNMLDAAFMVLSSFRTPKGDYKLKIRWFNRRGMDLGLNETVKVVQAQVGNWAEVSQKDNAE